MFVNFTWFPSTILANNDMKRNARHEYLAGNDTEDPNTPKIATQ